MIELLAAIVLFYFMFVSMVVLAGIANGVHVVRELVWMALLWPRVFIHPTRYGDEMWLFSYAPGKREQPERGIRRQGRPIPVAWQWKLPKE